ncbi:MAG: YadA-like family protein, partial [Veillonella nakazawae]
AMAALKPIQYDPLEPTQIMAGIGNYRGETAGAIGLAHYKTEDTMFNIGVTLGSSHNMINAGVTHKFGGSRDRKDAIPERYKAGPISSIYVMQDEVSHLRSQNEEYKSKLEQQQSEIDALKAAVNQLLANKA